VAHDRSATPPKSVVLELNPPRELRVLSDTAQFSQSAGRLNGVDRQFFIIKWSGQVHSRAGRGRVSGWPGGRRAALGGTRPCGRPRHFHSLTRACVRVRDRSPSWWGSQRLLGGCGIQGMAIGETPPLQRLEVTQRPTVAAS
jgi:hypothetical protein